MSATPATARADRVAPLVSIVIPAYEVAPLIRSALDSAFAQTMTDFEVIVVNDGSPDTEQLEAVLASYHHRVEYIVQANRGPSAARNAGIRRARGEFVAFLDADDVLLPFFLEEHLARVTTDSGADVFYGDLLIFGEVAEAGRTVMEFSPSSGIVDFAGLVSQRCSPMLCSMVRRRTLLMHGLFDETMRRSEDFDLWVRLAHSGVRFNYTNRVVARHCVRRGGLSADIVSMIRSMRAVFEKCARTMELTDAERLLLTDRSRHLEVLERFHEGKRAFLAGDHELARTALAEANASLRSRKIDLLLAMLSIAPQLAWRLYHARLRLLGRGDPIQL